MRLVLVAVTFVIGACAGLLAWALAWAALGFLGLLPSAHMEGGVLVLDDFYGSIFTGIVWLGSLVAAPFVGGAYLTGAVLAWHDKRQGLRGSPRAR